MWMRRGDEFQHEQTRAFFERAIALGPNDAEYSAKYAAGLNFSGQLYEALTAFKLAERLNPQGSGDPCTLVNSRPLDTLKLAVINTVLKSWCGGRKYFPYTVCLLL